MRQLGLPPKNAPNCVVMESKSEEEESGGVSPPHHSYMTLKSSEVQSLHRVKTPSFSFFTFKKIVKIRPGQNANYHDYQIHEIFTSDCRTFPNIPETGIYLLYIIIFTLVYEFSF